MSLSLIEELQLSSFTSTCSVSNFTCFPLTVFCSLDIVLQLVSLVLAFTLSMAFSDKSYADFLSQECAFFNIFVADLYQAMLSNPNKPIDLLFCTVPQKYFALVLFFLSAIVLPYDYISIATVLIIGTALHLTRNINPLNPVIGTIERTVGCGRACDCTSIGYITAEQGAINAV